MVQMFQWLRIVWGQPSLWLPAHALVHSGQWSTVQEVSEDVGFDPQFWLNICIALLQQGEADKIFIKLIAWVYTCGVEMK